jgi:spore maturation protein CgeB/glycosyltransferase involved in cell wall biosynthesis
MNKSLVREASNAFTQGDYFVALDLYKQLGKLIGLNSFKVNILLCEKHIQLSLQRKDYSSTPLKSLKVACVMDNFTFHSYDPECRLLQLTPEHVIDELEQFQPELLFIESAWLGKDELWSRKIGILSHELKAALHWCREHHVPTVFWNKEDPIHFETFLTTAQQFDYVFTTDIDCIARYKAALGTEHVFLLPFACQPKTHNPIELYDRKDAFCFAGAYYVRYPERTRDLETYVAEFPQYKPLEIYDRNFGKDDVNYQFPPAYQPYIVGTLPFNEIDKAYKGYRYAINLNSIKQSQTMFARRVYELLGSNTITVSNFSRGVRLMFGDLVIASDSGREIVERLQQQDDETAQKLRLAGLRKVMQEHTYTHRLAYVARKALGWRLGDAMPDMLVVAKAQSLEACRRIISNFTRQAYAHKKLVLVTEPGIAADVTLELNPEQIRLLTLQEAANTRLNDILESEQWLAPMEAEDYYGKNYLLDLAIASRYSNAQIIGKAARYQWEKGGIQQIEVEQAYRPAKKLSQRCSIVRADAVARNLLLLDLLEHIKDESWGQLGLSIDPFNYCQNGHRAPELDKVANRVEDQPVDTGLGIDELLLTAEQIAPDKFDETHIPRWDPKRLQQLVSSGKHIQITTEVAGLLIRSTLPDDKHEYLYASEAVALNTLPATMALKTHLDATPGLNVSYVFIFLDNKQQKISHAIHTANRNHSTEIPQGTAFVRFGWRISGSGASTIKSLLWGHRQVEPAKLLGRSDTLLLTNHYPQYDDLYRYAFVHSRVKGYKANGVNVDIFRLQPNRKTSYHEFENVDVTTGNDVALHNLLGSGRYKNVLVHFLSLEIWAVLQHYPQVKKVVWVHGAEIQPWHRRDFENENEQERSQAKAQSEVRMAFWRGLLQPLPPNLKFVFVSRYFAEEVMEDLGFRLPEEAHTIIHNPIDTDLFSYQPKPIEQSKKVLSIRPYASRTYANDLSVAAILKLSEKPFFSQMEFRMIGDGKLFDDVLAPLREFPNVIIENRFLAQKEIAALHKEYGIFLVPSRMDSQGVSRDEAMASGLVPVTNAVAAIPEFVDDTCAILANGEDAISMAEGIARLVESPNLFCSMSHSAAERVRRQSSSSDMILAELRMLSMLTN